MRASLGLLLTAVVAAACSSSNGPPDPPVTPVITVGGTYQTAVTVVSSTCPGQTVQQHVTGVNHLPGGTSLSLVHAGSTYQGTIAEDGTFSTTPVTQVFAGVSFRISIAGQFSETGMDALVTVERLTEPSCSFTARWAGPKSGGTPNVIP